MSEPLAGRAGIVTGAASGIGRHLAEAFVDAGARVALFDRDAEGIHDAAGSLGEDAIGMLVDITDERGVERREDHARPRQGEDPQHRFDRRGVGHEQPGGLFRQQGGHRRPDQGDGLRAGPTGDLLQRHRPRIIETPLTASYFEDEKFASLIVENTPVGRWGQPEDLADVAMFLCSDRSDFVQGVTLCVDGGWVAGKGY